MNLTFSQLAVPAVLLLIVFLSFSSQYLFLTLQPGPLDKHETIIFNSLITLLLISYARAILTDPGHIPKDWESLDGDQALKDDEKRPRPRWCRRCEATKPPRAHHCKVCKRY
jgi:palmitoyltransferase